MLPRWQGGLMIAAVSLSACSFEGAPPAQANDDAGDSSTPSSDAMAGDADASSPANCAPSITLRASRQHNPISVSLPDVRIFLPGQMLVFDLPQQVVVTVGSAANRCAFFDYTSRDGQMVRCGYHGTADGPHVGNDPTQIERGATFELINCMPADVAEFVECGGDLNQVNVSHQPVRATALSLIVDGDSDFDVTTGEVTLDGECEQIDG